MGGVIRGIGAAVAGSVGAVAGAGIGNVFGGGIGSAVGAGIGSIVGSGVGSVVGGLAEATGSATAAAGPLVNWSLPANTSETIVSLQQVSIPAVLLAIYRIANTGATNVNAPGGSVVVQTDNGPFTLKPRATIDVSTQTITISSGDKPAHGTYQLLGNALVGTQGT